MQAGARWKSSFRFTDTFCHTLTTLMFICSCHCLVESTQQTPKKDCQHNCRPQSVESNIKDQTLRQIRLLRSFQLAQLSIVNCQQRAGDATHPRSVLSADKEIPLISGGEELTHLGDTLVPLLDLTQTTTEKIAKSTVHSSQAPLTYDMKGTAEII